MTQVEVTQAMLARVLELEDCEIVVRSAAGPMNNDAFKRVAARLTAEAAKDAEIAELRALLRSVVSHASGGALDIGGSGMGLNDICVGISRHHNLIWEQAREKPAAKIAERDALLRELAEAVDALPVEEWVEADRHGDPELLGYVMQAQGEWDRVRKARQSIDTILAKGKSNDGG